jgi:hypothetical protein
MGTGYRRGNDCSSIANMCVGAHLLFRMSTLKLRPDPTVLTSQFHLNNSFLMKGAAEFRGYMLLQLAFGPGRMVAL